MAVTLEGFGAVIDALQKAPEVMRARLVDVIGSAKQELAQRIAQAAPRQTGALAESYQPSPRRGLTGFIGVAAGQIRGQEPSRYWHFVEFGTVNMGAQPHIVSTAERYGDVLVNRIRRAGQDIERDLASRGQRFL